MKREFSVDREFWRVATLSAEEKGKKSLPLFLYLSPFTLVCLSVQFYNLFWSPYNIGPDLSFLKNKHHFASYFLMLSVLFFGGLPLGKHLFIVISLSQVLLYYG